MPAYSMLKVFVGSNPGRNATRCQPGVSTLSWNQYRKLLSRGWHEEKLDCESQNEMRECVPNQSVCGQWEIA